MLVKLQFAQMFIYKQLIFTSCMLQVGFVFSPELTNVQCYHVNTLVDITD